MMPFRKLGNFIRKSISGLARPEKWFREAMGCEETYAGVEVSAEGALACSAVTACGRLLSESVASLPLHVYQRRGASKEKAADHPLYPLLHASPNVFMTSYTWRAQAMLHVLLHGNSYALIERDDGGRVRALWPLLPQNTVVKVKDGEITYEYFAGAQRRTYAFDDVLHVKGPSLDGIIGLSIINLARQGIGLALAQDRHGASTFKNRARPGVILKSPSILNDRAREIFRSDFAEKFEGALNAGRSLLLEAGIDIATVGFSNEDAQFLQSRQFSIQEIGRWFRVSPTMIGDLSRSTYSNSEQEQLAFLQHSLRPHLVNIEAEINHKLFADDGGQFFAEFDMAGFARGDLATRYEAYSKGLAAGFLTVADVRAWENLVALPGTDQLRTPANMLPAGGGNAT